MEIRQFTYVNMVAECKSITKAAGKLFISQPALSNYISKLEEDMGVRLFDRSSNPIRLTFAGEQYLKHAKQIMMHLDDMDREIRDISEKQYGRLRIGFPNERIIYMLPKLLPQFKELYPNVEVEVLNGPGNWLIKSLQTGDADFVFLPMWTPCDGINQFKVAEEELILVTAKDYLTEEQVLDRENRIFSWDRIEELPLLTLEKGHALRSCVDTLLQSSGKKPNIYLESHSNMLSCRLADAGMGVAVVPEITLHMIEKDIQVDWYHLDRYPLKWDVNALYRTDAYLGKVEQDFLHLARKIFA